jgi:hypothetical protein
MEPSMARMASPPADFSPKVHHGSGASTSNPKLVVRLARGMWASHPGAMRGAQARADMATKSNTALVLGDQDQRHLGAACTAATIFFGQ